MFRCRSDVPIEPLVRPKEAVKLSTESQKEKLGKIESTKIKKNALNCMYTNARSMMNLNKRDEIELLLKTHEIDILGITESWAHKDIEDAELNINGFTMLRKDRNNADKIRGVGVILCCKDELGAVREFEDRENKSETIWAKIVDQDGDEVYIGLCYRSPTATEEDVKSLFEQITHFSNYTTIIMGDFNYRDINWIEMESGPNGKEFLELVEDCFLFQHVDIATRGNNILDLLLTTEKNMVDEVEVICPISNSDHNVLIFKLNCKIEMAKKQTKNYRYDKGDYIKIKADLNEIKWKEIYHEQGVEEMWNFFNES